VETHHLLALEQAVGQEVPGANGGGRFGLKCQKTKKRSRGISKARWRGEGFSLFFKVS
jgi:hypothetical protein